MATTQGRRVYPDTTNRNDARKFFSQPGDYGKVGDSWMCRLPTWTELNMAVSLDVHVVVEHEDGTITVTPSILWDVSCMPAMPETWWHGHLTHGEWVGDKV
jgi:hypothetical protein